MSLLICLKDIMCRETINDNVNDCLSEQPCLAVNTCISCPVLAVDLGSGGCV